MSLLSDADLSLSRTVAVPLSPLCGACGLKATCITKGIPVYGKGRLSVLIVGGWPSLEDDEQGKPFCDYHGDRLRSVLRSIGVDLDTDCWSMYAVSCRPPKNRLATNREVEHCRPLVFRAIREYQPKTVVLLGKSAIDSILVPAWGKSGGEGIGGVERWGGYIIPSQRPNVWLVPTYHPTELTAVERKARETPMEGFYWKKHLESGFSRTHSPWEVLPDYIRRVRAEFDERKAVEWVMKVSSGDRAVSFDYETDRLKPDHPDARIVCCSVCDGETSVAFPWTTMTKEAVGALLRSSVPKYGWNVKFEEGWTRKEFGHGINNVVHDGMLAAHVADNRPGTKSLKFQAFAQLGQPSYDDEIKPYLEGETGNTPNRLREFVRENNGMRKCLVYCGMDSLLEWELAELQREELSR